MDNRTVTGPGGVMMSPIHLLRCVIPCEQTTHSPACNVGTMMVVKGQFVSVRNFTPSCPGYMDALRQLPRAISLVMGEKPDYMTYEVMEQQLEGLCDAVGSPYTALICEKFFILVRGDDRTG
jgi:hypothetical protein